MTSRRIFSRPASAFTLVELLVTIGILGVLAALVIGASGGAIRRAQDMKCAANLREVFDVLNAYAAEHDGAYPAIRVVGPPQVYWYMALASYAGAPVLAGRDYGDRRDIARIFRCPAARADFGAPSDSLIYRTYTAADHMRSNLTNESPWDKPVRPVTIAKSANALICVDGARTVADYGCDSGVKFTKTPGKISYRHGGKNGRYSNGLFFDGHVAPLKDGEISQEMWDKPAP